MKTGLSPIQPEKGRVQINKASMHVFKDFRKAWELDRVYLH